MPAGQVWLMMAPIEAQEVRGVGVLQEPGARAPVPAAGCRDVGPFLAVLIKKGPCMEVLWAFLLQLLGHIPA